MRCKRIFQGSLTLLASFEFATSCQIIKVWYLHSSGILFLTNVAAINHVTPQRSHLSGSLDCINHEEFHMCYYRLRKSLQRFFLLARLNNSCCSISRIMANTISLKELFQSFEIGGECLSRRTNGAKQRGRSHDENHKWTGKHVRECIEEPNTE